MTKTLLPRSNKLPMLLLLAGGLAACSHDAPTPAATISGEMDPVAGLGRLLTVTATSANKQQQQTVKVDEQTGAFAFTALPPGTYTLTFVTSVSTPDNFPVSVSVTVKAGENAKPAIPLLTHDGKIRGTMRWQEGGKTYAATSFLGLFSNRGHFAGNGYFYFSGNAGEANQASEVAEVFLVVPETNQQGFLFKGAGTYALGGDPQGAYGRYTYQQNGTQSGYSRYITWMVGPPTGTLHLTRFDYEQGAIAGTFRFVGQADNNISGQRTITNGEFSITF